MPRQNQPRSMGREDLVAVRIARLRQRPDRPWSYEALADAMSARGCAIQPTALWKIENGSPRRKITVDEVVALADVFEVSVQSLVSLPPDEVPAQAEQLLGQLQETWLKATGLDRKLSSAQKQVAELEPELDRTRREEQDLWIQLEKLLDTVPRHVDEWIRAAMPGATSGVEVGP